MPIAAARLRGRPIRRFAAASAFPCLSAALAALGVRGAFAAVSARRGLAALSARRGLAALLLVGLLAACDTAEERRDGHLASGLALIEAGEPDKAVLELTNALRIDDAFAPAHLALGRLHRDAGRVGPAIRHLQAAAEDEAMAADASIRIDLAALHLERRAPAAARAEAEAALALAPDDPEALALRAAAALLEGDDADGQADAAAALAADPEQRLARMALASQLLREDDAEGALAMIDAAPQLARPEGDVELELVRIRILEAMQDRAGVGEALARLIERLPADAGLRMAMARWRLQADPPDEAGALEELRAVAALDPSDAGAALRVVAFLQRTEGAEAAEAELVRLMESAEDADLRNGYERALAVAEARAGDVEAALARLEAAVEREGATEAGDAARLLLARFVRGEDAPARRVALIEAVIANDATNVEALAMRAELRIAGDDPEGAIADLRAALEGAPRDPRLLELLARAHERNGDDALAAERRALAVQATDAAAGPSLRYARQMIAEGRNASAEAALLDALRSAPRDLGLLTALAEARLNQEDWDGAREVTAAIDALRAEGEGGDRADAIAAMARQLEAASLFGEGRREESVALLEETWNSRGAGLDLEALVRAHTLAGDFAAARAAVEAALERAPGDVGAQALLAQLQAAEGDLPAAEATLRAALDAAPEAAGLWRLLAGLLEADGRPAEAAETLAAGLEAVPQDRALRFERSVRLERAGDFEGAIAVLEGLYAENPENDLVANNLASLISDHREDAESLAFAKTVARRLRGAGNPAFLDTYGWTLHLAGDSAQAVAVLRESAPRLEENAIAQWHLGAAYAAIGQRGLAVEQLRRALELADGGALFPQRAAAEADLARLEAELAAEAESQETDG